MGILGMTRIVLDSATVASLRGHFGPVELCDEHGHVLGEFRPAPDRSLYEGVAPPLSEDEIQRREDEPGGRSLAEILDDLRRRS
jgi:hypothetical protein